MRRIYIRADGNEIIATGHVMRCLSIAEQLREQGAEVIFLTADARPVPLIEDRGFRAEVLDTVWNDLDQETEKICDYVISHGVKLLLIDTYFVTMEYLERLSRLTVTAYIDDLNQMLYPVDTLIHYGVFTDAGKYQEPYLREGRNTDFLIGNKYIPLRKEFAKESFFVNPDIEKVLITTGGTDQLNMAGRLLREIGKNSELKKLQYHVIVGCFNQNKEELQLLAGQNPNIYIHENVTNMSDWMRHCDAAVSAAGTTIYELCACGIPTVCFEVADNQEGAGEWEKQGYMFYAGNACKDTDACIIKCMDALLQFGRNYQVRREQSHKLQSLIDGYGAKRIAEYLIDLSSRESFRRGQVEKKE